MMMVGLCTCVLHDFYACVDLVSKPTPLSKMAGKEEEQGVILQYAGVPKIVELEAFLVQNYSK